MNGKGELRAADEMSRAAFSMGGGKLVVDNLEMMLSNLWMSQISFSII